MADHRPLLKTLRRVTLIAAIVLGVAWLSGVRLMGFAGESMTPTVREGDHLVTLVGLWGQRAPKRFDLVIFTVPPNSKWAGQGIPWMKRVVGLPREQVRVSGEQLFINGRRIDAPFLHLDPRVAARKECELTLGDDQYFVLGDNLDHTVEDSRALGPIDAALLKGSVAWVLHTAKRKDN